MEDNIRSDGNTPFQIEHGKVEPAHSMASIGQTDGLDEPVILHTGERNEKSQDEPFFGSNIREAIRIIRGS